MNKDIITALRRELHSIPETSGNEIKTCAKLTEFLKDHTTLEVIPCSEGFYAAHREPSPKKPSIAIRADYDAIPMPDGSACHLCGHDGHAAALCGVALAIEGKQFGRDIFLLFQPAEETGTGAEGCLELFRRETVGEIYGAHNLPGFPFGEVTTRHGTFACASRGVTLHFHGKPTHAAYPEDGISPSNAVGELLCELTSLCAPKLFSGMTLCTVIGVKMGEKAFGSAASRAEVWLTLRAEHDRDLEALHSSILTVAHRLSDKYSLGFTENVCDVFPATENTPECADKVIELCGGNVLDKPMRWSEDFGHYLKVCNGAFFGIGAGEDHPPLHTADYEYPDELLMPTVNAFLALIAE